MGLAEINGCRAAVRESEQSSGTRLHPSGSHRFPADRSERAVSPATAFDSADGDSRPRGRTPSGVDRFLRRTTVPPDVPRADRCVRDRPFAPARPPGTDQYPEGLHSMLTGHADPRLFHWQLKFAASSEEPLPL